MLSKWRGGSSGLAAGTIVEKRLSSVPLRKRERERGDGRQSANLD